MLAFGRGRLTIPGGVEGLAFMKTRYANQTIDYPEFEIHFVSGSPASDGGEEAIHQHGHQ